MFGLFKKKITEAPNRIPVLIEKTISLQKDLYELLIVGLKCSDADINRLEVTYLAASIYTMAYLIYGQDTDKPATLDKFTAELFQKVHPSSKTATSYDEAIATYRARYKEHTSMLGMILDPKKSSTGSPEVTALMHFYERVTNSSAQSQILQISLMAPILADLLKESLAAIKQFK